MIACGGAGFQAFVPDGDSSSLPVADSHAKGGKAAITPCRLFTPDFLSRPTTVRETQSFNPEYCFALTGLLSVDLACTQGSGSRYRGILHPGLSCFAPSGLLEIRQLRVYRCRFPFWALDFPNYRLAAIRGYAISTTAIINERVFGKFSQSTLNRGTEPDLPSVP